MEQIIDNFCFSFFYFAIDFSCAFVNDIPLHGYLYITKNHIAFYSNVFGYVTKFVIPVTSLARISKEKTVKIIPNAIAVATVDERHVFSSFLSREAAYQLIISVWKEALPMNDIDVTTTAAELRMCTVDPERNTTREPCDITSESKLSTDTSVLREVPISSTGTLQVVNQPKGDSNSEFSGIDDESSSAMSENEGLKQLLQSQKPFSIGEAVLGHQSNVNNSSSSSISNTNSNPSVGRERKSEVDVSNNMSESSSLMSTPKTIESAFNNTPTINLFRNLQIPRTIHIAYFGLSLVIILALMAGFLSYCIFEVKNARLARTFSINDFKTVRDLVHFHMPILFETFFFLTINVGSSKRERVCGDAEVAQRHASTENTFDQKCSG